MSAWPDSLLSPSNSDLSNELFTYSLEYKDEDRRMLHQRLFEPICTRTFHLAMTLRLVFVAGFFGVQFTHFHDLFIYLLCGVAIVIHILLWIISNRFPRFIPHIHRTTHLITSIFMGLILVKVAKDFDSDKEYQNPTSSPSHMFLAIMFNTYQCIYISLEPIWFFKFLTTTVIATACLVSLHSDDMIVVWIPLTVLMLFLTGALFYFAEVNRKKSSCAAVFRVMQDLESLKTLINEILPMEILIIQRNPKSSSNGSCGVVQQQQQQYPMFDQLQENLLTSQPMIQQSSRSPVTKKKTLDPKVFSFQMATTCEDNPMNEQQQQQQPVLSSQGQLQQQQTQPVRSSIVEQKNNNLKSAPPPDPDLEIVFANKNLHLDQQFSSPAKRNQTLQTYLSGIQVPQNPLAQASQSSPESFKHSASLLDVLKQKFSSYPPQFTADPTSSYSHREKELRLDNQKSKNQSQQQEDNPLRSIIGNNILDSKQLKKQQLPRLADDSQRFSSVLETSRPLYTIEGQDYEKQIQQITDATKSQSKPSSQKNVSMLSRAITPIFLNPSSPPQQPFSKFNNTSNVKYQQQQSQQQQQQPMLASSSRNSALRASLSGINRVSEYNNCVYHPVNAINGSINQIEEKNYDIRVIECSWEGKQSLIVVMTNINERLMRERLCEIESYKDSVIDIISHNLKTPLNSILTPLENVKTLLDEESASSHNNNNTQYNNNNNSNNNNNNDQQRKQISMAYNNGQLLLYMINDMIDYSSIIKGDKQQQQFRLTLEHFKISTVIRILRALFDDQMSSKHLDFKVTSPVDLSETILCHDQRRLLQVLVNLISNALKFTTKGSIELHIDFPQISHYDFGYLPSHSNTSFNVQDDNAHNQQSPITLHRSKTPPAQLPQQHIRFAILDTGVGMSPARLQRLKDMLVRKERSYSTNSSGLGLTMCYALIKRLGCAHTVLDVNSKENEGTVFSFMIEDVYSKQNKKSPSLPPILEKPSLLLLPLHFQLKQQQNFQPQLMINSLPHHLNNNNRVHGMNNNTSLSSSCITSEFDDDHEQVNYEINRAAITILPHTKFQVDHKTAGDPLHFTTKQVLKPVLPTIFSPPKNEEIYLDSSPDYSHLEGAPSVDGGGAAAAAIGSDDLQMPCPAGTDPVIPSAELIPKKTNTIELSDRRKPNKKPTQIRVVGYSKSLSIYRKLHNQLRSPASIVSLRGLQLHSQSPAALMKRKISSEASDSYSQITQRHTILFGKNIEDHNTNDDVHFNYQPQTLVKHISALIQNPPLANASSADLSNNNDMQFQAAINERLSMPKNPKRTIHLSAVEQYTDSNKQDHDQDFNQDDNGGDTHLRATADEMARNRQLSLQDNKYNHSHSLLHRFDFNKPTSFFEDDEVISDKQAIKIPSKSSQYSIISERVSEIGYLPPPTSPKKQQPQPQTFSKLTSNSPVQQRSKYPSQHSPINLQPSILHLSPLHNTVAINTQQQLQKQHRPSNSRSQNLLGDAGMTTPTQAYTSATAEQVQFRSEATRWMLPSLQTEKNIAGGLEKILAGKHILIVDDTIYNIITLKILIGNVENLRIEEAYNGKDALEKFTDNAMKGIFFDFIFMDIEMPVMDGLECIAEIRDFEHANGLKHTLILTITAYERDLEEIITAGANALVNKPILKDKFLAVLKQLTQEQAAHSMNAQAELKVRNTTTSITQPTPKNKSNKDNKKDFFEGA